MGERIANRAWTQGLSCRLQCRVRVCCEAFQVFLNSFVICKAYMTIQRTYQADGWCHFTQAPDPPYQYSQQNIPLSSVGGGTPPPRVGHLRKDR